MEYKINKIVRFKDSNLNKILYRADYQKITIQ